MPGAASVGLSAAASALPGDAGTILAYAQGAKDLLDSPRDYIKAAAQIGGAAACTALGAAPLAPLCGSVAAAIIGPIFDAVSSLFSSASSKRAERRRRAARIYALAQQDLYAKIEALNDVANTGLAEITLDLEALHTRLGLPGSIGLRDIIIWFYKAYGFHWGGGTIAGPDDQHLTVRIPPPELSAQGWIVKMGGPWVWGSIVWRLAQRQTMSPTGPLTHPIEAGTFLVSNDEMRRLLPIMARDLEALETGAAASAKFMLDYRIALDLQRDLLARLNVAQATQAEQMRFYQALEELAELGRNLVRLAFHMARPSFTPSEALIEAVLAHRPEAVRILRLLDKRQGPRSSLGLRMLSLKG